MPDYSGGRIVTWGEIDMGTEENKDVVRQYLTAMHARPPNLDVFDELLAPNYLGDRAGGKAFAAALNAAVREQLFDIEDLVAEGDAVVARFNYRVTLPDGSMTTARGSAFFRLADSKIVVNDVMTVPDLMPVFARCWSLRPGHGPRRLTNALQTEGGRHLRLPWSAGWTLLPDVHAPRRV